MLTTYSIIKKEAQTHEQAKQKVNKMFDFLKSGSYLVTMQHIDPKADEKTYRGLYFTKVQSLAEETGHGKKEMHAIIKEHCLQPVLGKNSTRNLSPEEWLGFVKALELWAYQTYQVFLD